MELSKRAQNIEASVTLAAAAKAKKLKAQGLDILSLTVGEPDFPTPKHIQEAAIESIKKGQASFYTPTAGIPELRQAITDHIQTFYGLKYEPSQTIVTTGAKFALYLAFQVLLNPGDEVIVPTPYWVSYSEQIKLAEGVPVFVEGKEANDFKVTIEQLEGVVTRNSKVLLLNSPSNPTGMLYSKEELEAIGKWAVEKRLTIISDDIYGRLVYDQNQFIPIATLSDEIREKTLIINGVSKSYSMTGWRIGFAIGHPTLIQAMIDLASQASSNPTAASQYAALEALSGSQESVEMMRKEFEKRRNRMVELLEQVPGFTVRKPQGAFYAFPNVQKAMELTGFTDLDDFVRGLLEKANVAVVTGKGFGADGYIRLSYATDMDTLERAIDRIKIFVEKNIK